MIDLATLTGAIIVALGERYLFIYFPMMIL